MNPSCLRVFTTPRGYEGERGENDRKAIARHVEVSFTGSEKVEEKHNAEFFALK